jgi:hypothetical protein
MQDGVSAMRLSDSEQRLLAELELALTREDPRYVEQFAALGSMTPRWWRRWRHRLGALLPWGH